MNSGSTLYRYLLGEQRIMADKPALRNRECTGSWRLPGVGVSCRCGGNPRPHVSPIRPCADFDITGAGPASDVSDVMPRTPRTRASASRPEAHAAYAWSVTSTNSALRARSNGE